MIVDIDPILTAAQRILDANRYGFLTTLGEGGPSSRLVQHLRFDNDLRVIFGTGGHTRKAHEIRADPTVVYSVADPMGKAAVSLYGRASIDEDVQHRRAAWIAGLDEYFRGGPEDPEFVLIAISTQRVEVWSKHDRIHPAPLGQSCAVAVRGSDGWIDRGGTHPGA